MATWQVTLQPMIQVTASTQDQDVRYALSLGSAKNFAIWVNVLTNTSSTAPSIKILGAAALDLPPTIAGGTPGFWTQINGTVLVTANTVGAFTALGTIFPAPYMRWT